MANIMKLKPFKKIIESEEIDLSNFSVILRSQEEPKSTPVLKYYKESEVTDLSSFKFIIIISLLYLFI
jgi:hypothetical protein